MPAIETIYMFEEAIEAAAKSILATQGGVSAHRQRDGDDLTTPWAAVQLAGVTASGNYHMIGDIGYPCDFEAVLSVVIASNRISTGASHTALVGKARRYFYDLNQWTSALLPSLKVFDVMEAGSTANVAGDERIDTTQLNFRIKFLIRETAWTD